MLNNDLRITQVELDRMELLRYLPEPMFLTQEEFDLIAIKDFRKLYIITDSLENRVYLGEQLIGDTQIDQKYFLSINSDNEYEIYFNQRENFQDRLIPLFRYSDPQLAINALIQLNNIGSHDMTSRKIYNIIIHYITREISIHDMIIGIMSVLWNKDDPRFQRIIQMQVDFNLNPLDRDLPIVMREFLMNVNNHSNPLIHLYSNLYDIMIIFNLFKGLEFQKDHPEDIKLDEVINKIFNMFGNFITNER